MIGTGNFAAPDLRLLAKTRRDASQAELDGAAGELHRLFASREKEFSFHPDVIVEYPDVIDVAASPFLADPLNHLDSRLAALGRDGHMIGRVVILTTFADRLAGPLSSAGYRHTPILMPAGPDFTAWFELRRGPRAPERTLYLEAVNESDPRIRPAFALELHDDGGRLRGGACGSIHQSGGRSFAWLSTMTLAAGLPAGTGSKFAEALFAFLRAENVAVVHVGTQTAGAFYEKLGFRVIHNVLAGLRARRAADGALIASDLVMLELRL